MTTSRVYRAIEAIVRHGIRGVVSRQWHSCTGVRHGERAATGTDRNDLDLCSAPEVARPCLVVRAESRTAFRGAHAWPHTPGRGRPIMRMFLGGCRGCRGARACGGAGWPGAPEASGAVVHGCVLAEPRVVGPDREAVHDEHRLRRGRGGGDGGRVRGG